jgi:hypothetical protein
VKKLVFVTVLLALAMIISSSLIISAQDGDGLTSVAVDEGSLDPFAAVWDDAPVFTVALEQQHEEGTPNMTIDLQSIHNDDTIYILAVWADNTINNVRRMWHYDGEVWTRGDAVDGRFDNEDRMGIMFDINGGREFEFLGCGSVCHSGDGEDVEYMGYAVEGYNGATVDLWHWKATRTAGAGYADDQSAGMFSDEDPDEPTGRSSDSRDSGSYSDNKNEAGDGPGFTYPEGITSGPLLSSDAIAIDDTMTFKAGDTVPYYVLERPVGSRGDIAAGSFYVQDAAGNGWWYVVLARALDTGNEDDAVLTLGADHVFGIAVYDNGGGKKHATHGDPIVLTISE